MKKKQDDFQNLQLDDTDEMVRANPIHNRPTVYVGTNSFRSPRPQDRQSKTGQQKLAFQKKYKDFNLNSQEESLPTLSISSSNTFKQLLGQGHNNTQRVIQTSLNLGDFLSKNDLYTSPTNYKNNSVLASSEYPKNFLLSPKARGSFVNDDDVVEHCYTNDVDDEEDEDEIPYKRNLRSNLSSMILTANKSSFFNSSILMFNDVKQGPADLLERIKTPKESILSFCSSGRKDARPRTHEITSPKPKERGSDDDFDNLSFDDFYEQERKEIEKRLKSGMTPDQLMSPTNKTDSDKENITTNFMSNKNPGSGSDDFDNENEFNVELPQSNSQVFEGKVKGISKIRADNIQAGLKPNMEKLIKAIFDHDVVEVQKIMRKKEYKDNINAIDSLGNTPLMLCIKLSHTHLDYIEIIKFLLSLGADPKIRDLNGWSCLDEAVCQADVVLASTLMDYLMEKKRKEIKKQEQDLIKLLRLTPDFYLEMKWDFDSSIIPFISKLAPSDTFRIWKKGDCLRMDNSLVGFKNLKAKRREMSLIFNPNIPLPSKYQAPASLFTLNRTKNQYTNVLQNIDLDEKKYMLYDLLKADPLQGSFQLKNCQYTENKGFFGTTTNHKVENWNTKRFDFKVNMEYVLFKKSKAFYKDTFKNYKAKMDDAKITPVQGINSRKAQEIINEIKNKNGTKQSTSKKELNPSSIDPKNIPKIKVNIETLEEAKVTEKKGSASIWLAKSFPLKFDTLKPVINFLSNGNNLLEKMDSLLKRPEVQELIADDSFPVKLQVPITLSIKANITITKYESLKNVDESLFSIPQGFNYLCRKDAQKTTQRVKKRMVLINALT